MAEAISGKMPRDYRIDFFRGLALVSIFINHIPGNFFSNFTHRNFGLSDSAEVFVLLAGMSAALAYYPRFVSGQAALSIGQIAKRIGTIYIAHLSSIAIGFAVYAAATIWFAAPDLMVPDERHWMLDNTLGALAGIGALTYQTGNFNILPMYIGMMAMLPVIMMLARINLVVALAASAVVWLVANIFHFGPPNYPGNGVWVVADGMGGHSAGDFASETVLRHLQAGAFDAACRSGPRPSYMRWRSPIWWRRRCSSCCRSGTASR